jgi:hypothetical protein
MLVAPAISVDPGPRRVFQRQVYDAGGHPVSRWALTIHSSRRRLAALLSSGVGRNQTISRLI